MGMRDIEQLLERWQLGAGEVRERMYRAATPRERERWHALWLLARGWTALALAEALESANIEYIHLKALGDPKAGREAARRGDVEAFEKIFRSHLSSEDAQQALQDALDVVANSIVCLLCFERNHLRCHRAIVAGQA